ncbi:unnamed protein product [Somion occarium]|uniref:Brain protein I3 n=1 Tax=Somion occarium TaxID=3059160 RepID=A0ABP1DG20_9APHY
MWAEVLYFSYFVAMNEKDIGANFQQELYARCARGDHDIEKKYGPCGIITALACFPCGLICLFKDVTKKCSRCGTVVS